MSLDVWRQDVGTTPVVAVAGELDVPSVDRLTDVLDRVLDLVPAVVVVDLADVAFIDSSGLQALIHAHRTLSTHGGILHVVEPPERVRRVFEETALDTVLDLYPTRHAALQAVVRGATPGASHGSLAAR